MLSVAKWPLLLSQVSKLTIHLIITLMLLMIMFSAKHSNSLGIDHCYSDIGCFPLGPEFYHPRHRPINVRPWHRRRINTRFELFNKRHPNGYRLKPWNKLNLLVSNFNPKLETKIIVPGWLDNIKRALWVLKLKDSFLWLWKPVNIIVVHWRNFTPYTIATANTRVVGAELANLLEFLEQSSQYDRSYFHLIGHSLGAHICGYCGDRVPGLGRITALDPARPYFQGMPKSIRLDRGDAKFVDVIHSDFTPENAIFLILSFGMTTPVGHVDFYPNGPPLLQPGCLRDTLLSVPKGILSGLRHASLSVAFMESTRYLLACDHQRSHEWFIESITNRQCLFVGVRCNDFEGIINGRCSCENSQTSCAIMGIHADQMYLNNAHRDLWPLSTIREGESSQVRSGDAYLFSGATDGEGKLWLSSSKKQPLASSGSNNNLQYRAHQKDQLYSKLKYEAFKMRHLAPPSTLLPIALTNVINNNNNLESIMRDLFFWGQMRENSLLPLPQIEDALFSHAQTTNTQAESKTPRVAGRRTNSVFSSIFHDSDDDDDDSQDGANKNQEKDDDDDYDDDDDDDNNEPTLSVLLSANSHPKLMSDFDRDIENWYEGSSRWYLKTNNKPKYCVNQYQVLVFLGPLRSSEKRKGHHKHRIRANLILSIVGTRGQLMNQRFVPSSANLDSFTMQPFFILLEGPYSLGNILSVAVGWEARYDPDPSAEATVSFQSNALESLHQHLLYPYTASFELLRQSPLWPPLPASTTVKYDYSDGFRWRTPAAARRTDETSIEPTISGRQYNGNRRPGATRGSSCASIVEGSHYSLASHPKVTMLPLTKPVNMKPPDNMREVLPKTVPANVTLQLSSQPKQQKQQLRQQINSTLTSQFKELTTGEGMESNVPINLIQHKMGNLLMGFDDDDDVGDYEDDDEELKDTIVINQVVVNPLQVTYGRNRLIKLGKTFCPPHPNYKLSREQTIKLMPSLFGRCRQ